MIVTLNYKSASNTMEQYEKLEKQMIKIEIKTMIGTVLFSHETQENTIKKTLQEAVNRGADLEGAGAVR